MRRESVIAAWRSTPPALPCHRQRGGVAVGVRERERDSDMTHDGIRASIVTVMVVVVMW